MDKNKAAGSLLGLACGDALGTTLEFSSGAPGADSYPARLSGPHTDITGGGPFGCKPGQITDDTMMATCIARSIIALNGVYDPDECAQRYLRWKQVTFDIGGLTSNSLGRVGAVGARDSGRSAWEPDRQNCGNGGLMRCGPIGVYYADDKRARREATLDDAAITHFDPRSILACAALNGAIAAAINGKVKDAGGYAQAGSREASEVAKILRNRYEDLVPTINEALELITDDTNAAVVDAPFDGVQFGVTGHGASGFARTALRLAFWEVGHATSYAEGLIDCVNRGGDADTNGAIVGALLGARFGVSGIPAHWVDRVLSALQDGTGRHSEQLAHEFHPKALVDLYVLKFGEAPVLPVESPV